MEFWGVEVKSGTPLKVQPGLGMIVHLSQASFGEVKANKPESVRLSVNVDGKKLVLGTLMSDKLPQQLFDLVFDTDFELSHNSKSGSIFFFGYKADNNTEDPATEDFESEEEDEEEEEIPIVSNCCPPKTKKPLVPIVAEKAKKTKDSAAGKQKVKIVEPTKVVKPEDDDDSEEDSDFDVSDDSGDDKTSVRDSMDEDDDSDSEDDDTPAKVAPPSKKRGSDSAIKTPVSEKKAKLATPQKTDGKKSGHVSTPYPSTKQASKTPANTPVNKSNQKSPKSGGPHSCGPCKKGFISEFALQAHSKAKHSAEK